MSTYVINENGELKHYGVVGMRWGVRRAKQYLKKGDRQKYGAGIRKTYDKASKELDKRAKKADKKLERAYNQRDRAYQKADSFFSTERGRRKALARANKAMRDATRSANHARRWVKSMEKTFADTNVSLTKEQVDLGRKYLDIMNRRTFG